MRIVKIRLIDILQWKSVELALNKEALAREAGGRMAI
jgi:hypothetical protein